MVGCLPGTSYGLSPLFDLGDQTCGLEVRFVDDRQSEHLTRALPNGLSSIRRGEGALRLGNQRVGSVDGPTGAASLLELAQWAGLRSQEEGIDSLELRFVSPFFVRTDDLTHPLPVAGSVVGSLGRRLRSCTGVERVAFDPRALRVTQFSGETVALDPADFLGNGRAGRVPEWWGSIGTATHELRRPDRSARRELGFLASAAEWLGVGALTTYGLGLVEVATKENSA